MLQKTSVWEGFCLRSAFLYILGIDGLHGETGKKTDFILDKVGMCAECVSVERPADQKHACSCCSFLNE